MTIPFRSVLLASLFALSTAACGSTPDPRPPLQLRVGQPVPEDTGVADGRPIVVELQEGDELPLAFSVDGDLLATPADAPPVRLVAKRHFFLRVDRDGVSTSFDGVHFDRKGRGKGSVSVGLGVRKEGVRAEVRVVPPKHLP